MSKPANPVTLPLADYSPKHFLLAVVDRVATVTLNRPERKNPLTFESYRELTDFFRACAMDDEIKTIVVSGAGGNFSSGGDVFEIIGPLIQMDTKGLTAFTRMTGDLVKAMRACPQPIVAAVEGICAGAGAIVAMASDLRLAATGAKVAFLFNKVGLAGCDMGACAILPRIIGQSRASELLYTGRFMTAEEGERWGFFSRIVTPECGAGAGAASGQADFRRPDLRQHHDQAHAGDGMGDVGGGGDRSRGGRPGALHDHGRFRPRLRGVFEQADPGIRGELRNVARVKPTGRANARPMTGSAKPGTSPPKQEPGLRYAPSGLRTSHQPPCPKIVLGLK